MPITPAPPSSQYDPYNQAMWEKITSILRPLARKYIPNHSMTSWNGQRDDLVQDIVQETVVRTFIQMRKAERGESRPILSPELFAKRVMRNHLIDIARKESRIVHLSDDSISPEDMPDQIVDPSEIALDELEKEALFDIIAQVVVDLPKRQQTALLIDIADLTDFTGEPSVFQKALRKVNIDLEEYRGKLPEEESLRHRHSSLLSHAYKNVRDTVQSQLLG